MTPNQSLWEKGDFTKLTALMRQSGGAVVESLAIRPPLRALDLGCGDGTTAVPLAQAGAQVLGIDIARNLVEAGQRRANALGVADRLQFQHGDAGELQGVADQSYDLVLSAEPWSGAGLARLTMPVLLLGGALSPASASDLLPILARLLPNATVQRLEAVGHMAPVTHPQRVDPLIVQWLGDQA